VLKNNDYGRFFNMNSIDELMTQNRYKHLTCCYVFHGYFEQALEVFFTEEIVH